MMMLGFSVDLPSALRFFVQSFFMASTASYNASAFKFANHVHLIASEEPMVEVPIVFASSWEGALNSLAIIDTHPKFSFSAKCSAQTRSSATYGSGYRR
jgi:hypothetical protein